MKSLSKKINDIHLREFTRDNNTDFSYESFKSSLRETSVADLRDLQERLNLICMEFDPFVPVISDEILPMLAEFNLIELTNNPFKFTNTLLRILSILEVEINSRLH